MREYVRLLRFRWEHRLFWWMVWTMPVEFRTWFIEAKKGQGKTRYLARECCRYMRQGYRVASNFTVRDRRTGRYTESCSSWMDVLRLSVDALEKETPLIFVIDEIHLWMDSRAFKLTPAWFRGWLAQSRHYGVGLCGSVQNLRRLELVARELVDDLLTVEKHYFHLFLVWGPVVPFHFLRWVDPDSLGTDEMGNTVAYSYTKTRWMFPRWWAGYDTRELIRVEPWKEDDQLAAEVKALSDRAELLVAPGEIAAFKEWSDDVAA